MTAVFVANDQMALGLLRRLHEAGRATPGPALDLMLLASVLRWLMAGVILAAVVWLIGIWRQSSGSAKAGHHSEQV